MKLHEVIAVLDQLAPPHFAFDFDHCGLQLGDPNSEVTRGCIALDHSLAVVDLAKTKKCELLVLHHPLIWNPLTSLRADRTDQTAAFDLARNGIAAFAAHTNWDCAPRGISETLANILDLKDVVPFGPGTPDPLTHLMTYVPEADTAIILDAMASSGFGDQESYQGCSFASCGTGSFTPGPDSNPAIGTAGVTQSVHEAKLEWLIPTRMVIAAERLIHQYHPYEVPVIVQIPAGSRIPAPVGRIGSLPEPLPLGAFQNELDRILRCRSLAWGNPEKLIQKVGVIGGAAGENWVEAKQAGADLFVTGEIPQNQAIDADSEGFPVIAAGHYATEQPGMRTLHRELSQMVPEVDWILFEPEIGRAGRPA